MAREIGIWQYDMRNWQYLATKAVNEIYDRESKNFLAVATPGAGKTTFALRNVHKFLQMNIVDRIEIVVPTEHLKKQWANAASRFGIDLDPNHENGKPQSRDYHGIVTTYAAVGSNPKAHRILCDNNRTLVIPDEIHHAGDSLTWGNATQYAYENAVFRIGLSGTAFRRDNNPIPFVRYENNICKADYIYSYSEAIADGVCRKVNFLAFDGVMKWEVNGREFECSFDDEFEKGDEARESERLRTALNVEGDWLRHVLSEGEDKLLQLRRGVSPNAGGLILAIDQEHAKQIAILMERITGEEVIVVVSDDKEASSKIKAFAENRKKWIVAVKMISEGVDIPRIMVMVYATNVISELFFRQAIGREVRVQRELGPDQEAFFFMPKDTRLVRFAKTIEAEVEHGIKEKKFRKEREGGEMEFFKEFIPISSVATHKEQVEIPLKPIFEQIKQLRDDITSLAKVYAKKKCAGKKFIDWNIAHKDWFAKGGRNIDQEGLNELIERKKWLENQIKNQYEVHYYY